MSFGFEAVCTAEINIVCGEIYWGGLSDTIFWEIIQYRSPAIMVKRNANIESIRRRIFVITSICPKNRVLLNPVRVILGGETLKIYTDCSCANWYSVFSWDINSINFSIKPKLRIRFRHRQTLIIIRAFGIERVVAGRVFFAAGPEQGQGGGEA